ncbi:DNA-deoxyinosine glycosylase [Sphingomonas sp. BN140010]|uniref:DNA-deoxyinosine glycosylase n=1 Tax=Sphingomonas arvum TaxID=2992113 RepID=A0ABT3JC49_9SPHN|nr:DNA-deoxyinosine glycosylase [Sphingomonas sp. BN140010]MCW3796648.1 DNA-deoxyinosine glycosylase [Sphingomonas sp. BN140010]
MSPRVPKSSFPPVVDQDTRLLICGSLPGEASLRATRYYAHPQNQFWRLLEVVLEEPLAGLAYEERLAVLRRRGIGLWDTVATAHRTGSLDQALREVTRNSLQALAATLPILRGIGFNGATAAKLGRYELAGTELTLIDLPSSSPAYTLPLNEKAERWTALRPLLG